MKVSADMGHQFVKIHDGLQTLIFPAIVGEVFGNLMGEDDRDEIETPLGHWYVGETAATQSLTTVSGRDQSWAVQPEYRALLLFGIAALAARSTNRLVVDLAIGLPIRDYRENKDAIVSTLVGDFRVKAKIKGVTRSLIISIRSVLALPQGFAPASPFLDLDATVATLDLGSRTINYATFRGVKLLDAKTDSNELGAMNMLLQISSDIADKIGRVLAPLEVVKLLSGAAYNKRVMAHGKWFDASEIIARNTNSYSRSVLGTMSLAWGDIIDEISRIIVVGGGAYVAGGAIKEKYPDQAVIPNLSQIATVISQYEYLDRKVSIR